MGRLLLYLALPLSLVVPGGLIAYAAVSATPDQESIQLPVTPTPAPADTPAATTPETETFKLFNGATVRAKPGCLDDRGADEKKKQAVSAAKLLPALKQKTLDADRDLTVQERKYKRFLDQHPEKTLTSDEFATYATLKKKYELLLAKYKLAEARYNDGNDEFNRLADLYNADLEACKLG